MEPSRCGHLNIVKKEDIAWRGDKGSLHTRPGSGARVFCFRGGVRFARTGGADARMVLSPKRVWAISTARLWTSPSLHLRPIYVIVFDGPCVEILS